MRRDRGFTLIELALVLAVLTILAMIAAPAYQGIVLRSRAVEARTLLESIADAELRYFRDHGRFIACPAHPPQIPRGGQAAFSADAPGFHELGVRIEGGVRYRYEVVLEGDGFRAVAEGDLDADGKASRFVLDGKTLITTAVEELE